MLACVGIVAASVRENTQAPQLPRHAPAMPLGAKECQALLMQCHGLVVVALIAGSQSEIEQRPRGTPLAAEATVDAQSGLVMS